MADTQINGLTELAAINAGDWIVVDETDGLGGFTTKKYDLSGLATAETQAHAQNTDVGTTSTTFQVDSGNSGPKVKNNSDVLEVRNNADDAYLPIKASEFQTDTFTLTVDETASISDKADKDTDAVVDNLAVFDANGNPVDSGISKNLVYRDPAYTLDIQPTLNLDFANQAYRSHVPGSGLISWPLVGGDSKITVTRATTATYFDPMGVLRTAAAGVPRIDHDPATGECLGLLVEEQRPNLLKYSEQFDNGAWVKIRSSISANSVVAPDGETTADKLIESTDNNSHYIQTGGVVYTAQAYTASIFIKAAERDSIYFGLYDGTISHSIVFNANSNVFSAASNVSSWESLSCGGGWYRVSITFTANAGVGNFGTYLYNGGTSYTGDGTSGLYIWGAQLEAGA